MMRYGKYVWGTGTDGFDVKAMVKEKLKVIIEYRLEKDFNNWTQCFFSSLLALFSVTDQFSFPFSR
jgi:hypothetical protein